MMKKTGFFGDLLSGLVPFYERLTAAPLTRRERNQRAAYLFPHARRFVTVTAEVIRDFAEFFPDAPVAPDKLLSLQDRANEMRALRAHFLRLARMCGDEYLLAQSAAIDQAFGVVLQVRREAGIQFRDGYRQAMRLSLMDKIECFAPNRRAPQEPRRRGRK